MTVNQPWAIKVECQDTMLESLQCVVTAVGAHLKLIFYPCACGHGASALAFIWEYVLRMQRNPFLRTSAPQIESLRPRKSQWWLSISFSIAWHSSPHLAPHKGKPGKHIHKTSSRCTVGLENHHQLVLQLHKSRV